MTYKVVKVNMNQWAKHLEELGERFMPAMQRGAMAGAARCIPILHTATINARPASPRGGVGAFDTGLYKAAWRSGPVTNGARVFNTRPYSPVIEGGRRASPMGREGIRNLQAWAKRKLKLSDKEARDAAWAIAKTQEKRPLEARRVMNDVERKMIKTVEAEITHELDVELGR